MKARTAGIFFYERTKPPPAAAPAPPRPRATDCVSHSFIIAIDIVEFIPALLHPIHFSKNKTAGSFTSKNGIYIFYWNWNWNSSLSDQLKRKLLDFQKELPRLLLCMLLLNCKKRSHLCTSPQWALLLCTPSLSPSASFLYETPDFLKRRIETEEAKEPTGIW